MPRMQIPFHRRRGSPCYRILTLEEQSLPWHLAGGASRLTAAGASAEPKTGTTCPLLGKKKKKNSQGVPAFLRIRGGSGQIFELWTRQCSARSSIFPAAAEARPPQRGSQFHLPAHVSLINAKTSRKPPLLIIAGPLMGSGGGETSRSVRKTSE